MSRCTAIDAAVPPVALSEPQSFPRPAHLRPRRLPAPRGLSKKLLPLAAVAASCPLTPQNVTLSMLPASGETKLQRPARLLPPLSFPTLQPLTCPFVVFFLWRHVSSPGDLVSLYCRPSRLRVLLAPQRYPVQALRPQCCKQNPYQQRKIKQIALH